MQLNSIEYNVAFDQGQRAIRQGSAETSGQHFLGSELRVPARALPAQHKNDRCNNMTLLTLTDWLVFVSFKTLVGSR